MKKIHISYGDKLYTKSLDLLEKTTIEIGKSDEFIRYNRELLETTEFYQKNKYILDQQRGNGLWLWKPFIILETFKNIENGDIVIYSDAGLSVIDNLTPLYLLAQNEQNLGRIVFKLPAVGVPHHKIKAWTRRDAFVLTISDEEKYWNADMTNGAVSVWVKNDKNIEFISRWLRFLRDPRIIMDGTNMCGKPNFPEFRDHRHDQSVLSLLIVKENMELYRDPTQYGNSEKELFFNSPYNQLFHHHRNFKH